MGYVKVAPKDCLGCGILIAGRGGKAVLCEDCAQQRKREQKSRARRTRKPLTEEQRQRRRERERGKKRVRTPEQEARHKAAVAAWKAARPGYIGSPAQQIKYEFRKHLKAGYRLAFLPCIDCGALVKWMGRGYLRKRCDACLAERKRRQEWERTRRGKVRTCPCCGVQWCGLKQSGQNRTTSVCSDSCRDELNRAWRKAGNRKRRGKLRGCVNKIKVFNRDGWKCKACGCDTPRHLKGTLDDNAPELDHIVPLCSGGEHSYANTQCLCRVCNLMKGSMPMDVFVNQWLTGGWSRATTLFVKTGAAANSSNFATNEP